LQDLIANEVLKIRHVWLLEPHPQLFLWFALIVTKSTWKNMEGLVDHFPSHKCGHYCKHQRASQNPIRIQFCNYCGEKCERDDICKTTAPLQGTASALSVTASLIARKHSKSIFDANPRFRVPPQQLQYRFQGCPRPECSYGEPSAQKVDGPKTFPQTPTAYRS